MNCRKTRKEIEKATFLDGKGEKINRIGENLNIDYGPHRDDRNIKTFYTYQWLPRLKKMTTSEEIERQITNFLTNIPSFHLCDDAFQDQFLIDIINERERVIPVLKVVKGVPQAAIIKNFS